MSGEDRDLHRLAEELAERLVAEPGPLLVVTGAGVSLASGIPTFRGTDPGAVWKNDVMEKGTYAYFRRFPVESWGWYAERFPIVRDARPNPSHHALAELERWYDTQDRDYLLVTQNVDGLHREAGSERLVEVHGCSRFVRCARDGCSNGAPTGKLPRPTEAIAAFLEAPGRDTLPRCASCGDVLRPHVLWFDEYYGEHLDYQWDRTQQAAASAALVLFVGTSFSVGVTDLIAQHCTMRRTPALSIDPGAARPPYRVVEPIAAAAEELLPLVVQRLERL
ncbi:MAG: RNA polymerase subunit sigma [Acidobacteria bacterium]|nr:MAG: RNA polymerase subunit sigma [Acidobacteriota bacterium]REK11254.1 MAG: RNA polymerase subunit sigma [Acidobacteriota bacterium]